MMKGLRTIMTAAAVSAIFATGVQAEQMRLISSWDPSFPMNEHFVTPFMKRVAERSNGALTVTMDGPEVVAPFSQFEPVQVGLYQMLFTHAAYHTGETRLALPLEANTMPDPEQIRETGLWDEIDAGYNEKGLKLLGITSTGAGAYQILLRDKPTDDENPLAGMRVRGSPPYAPVIEEFGGTLVVLPAGEIYSAMDRAVVEGAGWPVVGTQDSRLTEVSKYYMTPGFGAGHYMMLMNLDAFNALDEASQDIILSVAAEVERESAQVFAELTKAEVANMQAEGLEPVTLSEDMVARMTGAFATGLGAMATANGESAAERVVAFMRENGMM
jgi:TRAP-type C4-dicarboxylate transport system substrate-binding protein